MEVEHLNLCLDGARRRAVTRRSRFPIQIGETSGFLPGLPCGQARRARVPTAAYTDAGAPNRVVRGGSPQAISTRSSRIAASSTDGNSTGV